MTAFGRLAGPRLSKRALHRLQGRQIVALA